jgi:diketogulonate reductase-like aldo/keto reductase
MQKVILNNGVKMPVIGFGTYQITDPGLCERCICDAVNIGYRSIDTAAHYNNLEAVGIGIKNCGVPRDDLFITSKLLVKDNSYERAKIAIDQQLTALQLDYLDLFLIHHPFGDTYGAWRALDEANRAGKIRVIGVSNFEAYRLMDFVLNNETIPAVNQVETHPYCQQHRVRKVMDEFDIKLVASETLAQGRNNLFNDERFVEIGKRYHKTASQVVLRWHLQRNDIIIPKSTHKNRIAENFDIFNFNLTDKDMSIFDPLDTGESIFVDRRDPERVRHVCTHA